MNRKIDTGKTLKRWPVLVDRYKPLNAGNWILAGEGRLQVASVDLIPDEVAIVEQLIHLICINTQRGGLAYLEVLLPQ